MPLATRSFGRQKVRSEHLDIRAVTMGISLRDCPTDDLHRTCQRVYDKITRSAGRLVDVAKEVEGAFGVPITNKRISVTALRLDLTDEPFMARLGAVFRA